MPKQTTPRILWAVLLVSILINLAAAFFAGKRLLNKSRKSPYSHPQKLPYYLGRDKLFEALPSDTGAIVFLGNSLTQYYELAELFPGRRVKNRGIHGDMLEKVLLRLAPIISSKPRKIFIELGVNDIEQQVPKDEILRMYGHLLETLSKNCPSAKLYVQSLLPVADTSAYLPPTYSSPQMNQSIAAMNPELQSLARHYNCTFINLYDAFLQNGQLNPLYSVDGVHLSGEGYLQWTKVIRPYVEE